MRDKNDQLIAEAYQETVSFHPPYYAYLYKANHVYISPIRDSDHYIRSTFNVSWQEIEEKAQSKRDPAWSYVRVKSLALCQFKVAKDIYIIGSSPNKVELELAFKILTTHPDIKCYAQRQQEVFKNKKILNKKYNTDLEDI